MERSDGAINRYWQDLHETYLDEARNSGVMRLVTSAVVCVNRTVLLVRRSPNDTYPGMWEYPGGGVDLEQGESVVGALIREVSEETGIQLPEFPSGEVMVHPTRTAVRIVLRFDIPDWPEITLSDEHDLFAFIGRETVEQSEVAREEILQTMRDENSMILDKIFASFES